MNPYVKLLLALALVGAGWVAAWEWQVNSYEKKIADLLLTYSSERAKQLDKLLDVRLAAEKSLASLDEKATKEKIDALAKNDSLRKLYNDAQAVNARLRTDVADGYRRLHLAGSCSGSASDRASTPSSMGNASTFELSPAAGQTVFDIRAGIIADQAALAAAQAYIQSVCLTGRAKGSK